MGKGIKQSTLGVRRSKIKVIYKVEGWFGGLTKASVILDPFESSSFSSSRLVLYVLDIHLQLFTVSVFCVPYNCKYCIVKRLWSFNQQSTILSSLFSHCFNITIYVAVITVGLIHWLSVGGAWYFVTPLRVLLVILLLQTNIVYIMICWIWFLLQWSVFFIFSFNDI